MHPKQIKIIYLQNRNYYKIIKHDKQLENYFFQVKDMTERISFIIAFVSLYIISAEYYWSGQISLKSPPVIATGKALPADNERYIQCLLH